MPAKKTYLFIFTLVLLLTVFGVANAQQTDLQNVPMIYYSGQPVVDSDLDGLTDEGEKQLYNTDPNKVDSDEDTYDDGVEILAGTDPADEGSFPGMPVQLIPSKTEIPWAWYVSRAGALVSFLLLWISIFLGLAIHTPVLNKIIKPVYSYGSHCWISLLALLFALFHGTALMFDKAMHFSLLDIFVPFTASYEPGLVAMGTLAFYLMLLLVVTSYAKKLVPHKIWRMVHTVNIILYAFGIIHALNLGTDLQGGIGRNIFIWANALLVILFLANIEVRLAAYFRKKYFQPENA